MISSVLFLGGLFLHGKFKDKLKYLYRSVLVLSLIVFIGCKSLFASKSSKNIQFFAPFTLSSFLIKNKEVGVKLKQFNMTLFFDCRNYTFKECSSKILEREDVITVLMKSKQKRDFIILKNIKESIHYENKN